jgi:predicted DCC family thiol-disulfide oxidoreductase YuxK
MSETPTDLHRLEEASKSLDVSAGLTDPEPIVHEGSAIILYDGVCGFCNRFTVFVLARDEHNLFQFASLQSPFAAQALGKHGKTSNLDTVYVIVNAGEGCEQVLCRSEAILFVLSRLRTASALGRTLRIIPKRLADLIYNLFARYRYAFFGELEICALPSQGQRAKFIDRKANDQTVSDDGPLELDRNTASRAIALGERTTYCWLRHRR